jgi:hypothetical protein
VRIARILAILLALATLGVSIYFLSRIPYLWYLFVPANVGATGSLLFWIKAPARKKARWRAAFASLLVVPCIALTAVAGLLLSPVPIWQVFGALSALALLNAIWAFARVKKKADHPWADYYAQVN